MTVSVCIQYPHLCTQGLTHNTVSVMYNICICNTSSLDLFDEVKVRVTYCIGWESSLLGSVYVIAPPNDPGPRCYSKSSSQYS